MADINEINQKIDKLIQTTSKTQSDVEVTKNLALKQAENQEKIEKKLDGIEKRERQREERDRAKNVVLFRFEEKEENYTNLVTRVGKLFGEAGIVIPEVAILDVQRIGPKTNAACRPVRVKLIAERWKYVIFEKTAELKALGVGIDSDIPKENQELKKKILKARYILRHDGKVPYMRGLSLKLNKRKLTERELDEIISNHKEGRSATNEESISEEEAPEDDDSKSGSSQMSVTSAPSVSTAKTTQAAALRKMTSASTIPNIGKRGSASVITRSKES